ncbi:VpaChn25_0724 family phage protein [Segnochrobactrum spirostomi]|uniref:ArsR family transcriptional regulator n=1 Tax=Segnochrobactrum spirostomi TaxID=2608987 RepID=A0A6A7Y4J3_9HYPH|nr:hypothetical protein [Segnochrobactrum spirostomi]MQT13655.1 hypothetical protein [Segnochrobactrum spirostomi]
MSMENRIVEEARLIILRALAEQPNESLSSEILRQELASFAISRERGWVHGQLDWLAEERAVTVTPVGSVRVATLAERGARHLRREIAIEGVQRPSRPD